jgi:hypothetical protein
VSVITIIARVLVIIIRSVLSILHFGSDILLCLSEIYVFENIAAVVFVRFL